MAGIELRDYQLKAVEQMKNGCILCGGVGSGKSRTSLAYYYVRNGGILGTNEYVPMNDPPKDLYIITTARKRDTLKSRSGIDLAISKVLKEKKTFNETRWFNKKPIVFNDSSYKVA